MATFIWELQGTTPTTIGATDILQFAGAAFNDPVIVGDYNDSTHVKSNVGANDSSGNSPRNNKFISQTGGSGGKSQVQVDGAATELLDALTNGDASIHIDITEGVSVTISDAVFYSYDGSTPATPAPGIDVRAAEIGDTNFVQAEGSAAALALTDHGTPATNHDYYIVISKSPTSVGLKPDTLRFEGVIA